MEYPGWTQQEHRTVQPGPPRRPDLRPAYADLAYCYADGSDWFLPPKHAMNEAKKNALRAVELDDSVANGHTVLARVLLFHELDLVKGDAEFQHALRVAPRNA